MGQHNLFLIVWTEKNTESFLWFPAKNAWQECGHGNTGWIHGKHHPTERMPVLFKPLKDMRDRIKMTEEFQI